MFIKTLNFLFALLILLSCNIDRKPGSMGNDDKIIHYKIGQYGYDRDFLKRHNASPIELVNDNSRLTVVPKYQGRVMTCTSAGLSGNSYGWINYDLIASGIINNHANLYGGGERLWLGPERGQFSIFYLGGDYERDSHWIVPSALDREEFNVVNKDSTSLYLEKVAKIINRAGTIFDLKLEKSIKLLDYNQLEERLKIKVNDELEMVAYHSSNRIKNIGDSIWDEKKGTLSIWMLSVFHASSNVIVIIPVKSNNDKVMVNDYFANLPDSMLRITGEAVFFKADGKFRSKIGLAQNWSLPIIASYDKGKKELTLIQYLLPENKERYVNSFIKDHQKFPFSGDVINVYNDGPSTNGEQIGEFYELEISSPAAFLKPGEELVHEQTTYHFRGDEKYLNSISKSVLGVPVSAIKNAINQL